MPRNIRTNFLTDKSTFGSSTMPIGSIVPIFKADDDKITDNGIVTSLGSIVGGAGAGTGYVTNLGTVTGFPTTPITATISSTNLSLGNVINLANHPFIEGDKLTVVESDQAPNKAKLGASIASFVITDPGSGYTSAPIVSVVDTGSGPASPGEFSATIDVATGQVTGITVTDGGVGYQLPTVTLSGGGGSGAQASVNLASGGEGGVQFEKGFVFYVDYINANSFRLTRSNGDIAAGKFYNITSIGSTGTFELASASGFGLTVGVAANLDGSVNFATIKKPGYGYTDGDVVYILQPGSSGTARMEIVATSSTTADDPALQYPGFLYCDGSTYEADEFPLLYEVIKNQYGGTGGTYDVEDFGSSSAVTFSVPDYKTKKLVGAGGGVTGGGSPVSGNVISTVGATGGQWYFSKQQQTTLYDIGNIVISGYTNVTEFVGGSLTGEVTLVIGPLQDKPLSAVPEHDHAILTSTAPEAGAFEGSGFFVDDHLASFKSTTGQVSYFLPSGGAPLFHQHGIVDSVITDPSTATYGNVSGIGEKVTKIITATSIIGSTSGGQATTTFNIANHGLFTGNMIRVQSNDQTTQAVFVDGDQNLSFATNTVWWVIKIDDNNFQLARSKYDARNSNALTASTNGSAGQDIILEMGYRIAGNLPADTTTIIQTPNDQVWDIDNTYTIGGKTITLPGGSTTTAVKVAERGTEGTTNVPAPTSEQLPIAGVSGFLSGAGGGGGTTDTNGGSGGNSYYQFNYGGNTIRIIAEGGDGGNSGNGDNAGGSANNASIQIVGGSSTNITSTGTYTVGGLDIEIGLYYAGNPGGNGGATTSGAGGVSSYFGGAGGDGVATLYTGTNSVSETFSTPSSSYDSYNIPNTWPLDSLTGTVRGGGGGSGGTGDGGASWHAGNGGPGKEVVALINQGNSGTLRVYVGGGGNAGSGKSPGSGGVGFAEGGNGGNGSGGGGGGGGGGASSIGTASAQIIGAGGGGGGGAAGSGTQTADMNAGGNPVNDGAQELAALFSGTGSTGNNSVCSGGGGGGGGGGVGSGSGIGGGGGGGNGSNARRSGYGASRGQSSIKSSGTGPTASLVSEGDAGNAGTVAVGQQNAGGNGSVVITAVENTTYYGEGGGGGASGTAVFWEIADLTNINAGSLVVGGGGNSGGEDGGGNVNYLVTEQDPGSTGTSVTSGLFDLASVSVDYVQSGTGTGADGGFVSNDTQKYLRFFGNEATRWARTIAINASSSNGVGAEILSAKFRTIRGNGSNGGEQPNEPLELFGSNDGANSFQKLGTISTASGSTVWQIEEVQIPTSFRVSNLILEVRQERSSAGNPNNDNYGIDYVAFTYEETETQIVTYPSGQVDLGVEFITERIEPQGDPINSAGIDVNEGTFTLSSAVKLNVDFALQPEIDIPLLTRYHLVKYMIRAF